MATETASNETPEMWDDRQRGERLMSWYGTMSAVCSEVVDCVRMHGKRETEDGCKADAVAWCCVDVDAAVAVCCMCAMRCC